MKFDIYVKIIKLGEIKDIQNFIQPQKYQNFKTIKKKSVVFDKTF